MTELQLRLSDQEATEAVMNRDSAYDGRFYFGVVTTGIYCLPSCSSRQPRPENLRFFVSGDVAEQAGFRACKRCKPDTHSTQHANLIEVARYIESHVDERLSLNDLASQFSMSPTYLQKSFKAAIGLSPKTFQDGIRREQFKSLLKKGQSVTDAVFEAGYGSVSRVYENTESKLGMSPASYRAGAKGELIHYIAGQTALGVLMLAATNKGVCFAMFGEVESELLAKLESEFPKATLTLAENNKQVRAWFVAINKHLSSKAPRPSIPLDIRGTAFQLKVWQFLQSIDDGTTVSYTELAKGIGQPTATRSAATACGKNRIAVLVPCHRVLRGDGSLGGFRWGLERKQQLLDIETSN